MAGGGSPPPVLGAAKISASMSADELAQARAKRLRDALDELGCTASDLATAIGCEACSTTVYNWCSGRYWPGDKRFLQVCVAVNKPPSYFYT